MRGVFLDRDGVLNRAFVRDGKPYPPSSMAEFEILPGVQQALEDLRAAGFALVVVTNQPDVGTGRQSMEKVSAFHRILLETLPISRIEMCCHVDADGCNCRKPKPGMLIAAAEALSIDLADSFMIGDRWRDVHAGAAAGCRGFLVDYGYAEKWPPLPEICYKRVSSLADAAQRILSRAEPGNRLQA